MTPMEHLELAAMYARKLESHVGTASKADTGAILDGPARQSPTALFHAAWMCGQLTAMAHRTLEVMEAMATGQAMGVTIKEQWVEARLLEGKCNRWLGFVQGVLWMSGIYTIDQLRDHVRLDEAALAHVSGKDDEEPERDPSPARNARRVRWPTACCRWRGRGSAGP